MIDIIYLPFPLRLLLLVAFLPICCFGAPIVPLMDCIDIKCPAAGQATKENIQMDLMDIKNTKFLKCTNCEDCIHSGYSVCSLPQNYDSQTRQLITQKGQCHCAHSGPAIGTTNSTKDQQKCQLLADSRQTEPQELDIFDGSIFRNCYSSAFRKLPTPNATNDAPISGHMLVTIDQFWHTDYWKGLRPEQLYLVYEFPVFKEEHCEAHLNTPTAEDINWINANRDQPAAVRNTGLTWLCRGGFRILMTGIERDDEEIVAQQCQHQQHGQEQTVDAKEPYVDEEYEPNSPPEVQFERDIFAGAKRVRFHYELMVHRDNFLVRAFGEGIPIFPSPGSGTLIKSDILDFDLHPGRNRSRLPSEALEEPQILRPVNIGQDKTGIDEGQSKPTVVQPIGMMKQNGTMDRTVGTVLPMPTAAQQEVMKTFSSAADGDHSSRADWLLLRNIIIFMLFLLAVFVALCIVLMLVAIFWTVAFCHNRRICHFPFNGTTTAGKIQLLNVQEYTGAEEAAGHQMTPI